MRRVLLGLKHLCYRAVAELAETGRTLSPIREKHASGAKQAAEKLAVLKGHGFSRPVERPKQNAALAAEGMQVVENTFPQRLKSKTQFAHLAARLKPRPFKATQAFGARKLKATRVSAAWNAPFFPLGWVFMLACLVALAGCHGAQRDPGTVVFLIDSSPANLDPRIGTDGQSEHIDELLFDGLVARDASFHFTPALAERWEQPNPLTLVFHLRSGLRFHDGRPLTARDVLWTINSMRSGAVISAKAATYASVDTMDAPDERTVVLHLKHADNFLLTNLSTGAIGIVPEGSGRDFWQHPVGTGPFRFVSQQIDQDVVVERNPLSWALAPKINRVRFAVVPDAITESLELEKGSADLAINSLPMDSLPVLAARPDLQVEDTGGTQIQYLAFNLRDPLLKDVRVRQAVACAIDRNLIIQTLKLGHAQPAVSLLPPTHWAWTGDVARYDYDPARAARLLDEAGHPRGSDGVRFHLAMKTSNDEGTRLLAAVMQQELAGVGIALDLRSYEYATFYADVTRGAFQMYSLHWIGGNEQPDIFSYVFSTARFSPKGANRGHYSNARLDSLLDDAAESEDPVRRRADYVEAQQILARDLPAINLWYRDTVVVHNRRLTHVIPSPSGSYTFLETAELKN
jgi:peptide/nickel transport system substrate-binding protein